MTAENDLNIMSRILFKNEACIAVNKLKGEASQQAANEGIVNLPMILKEHLNINFIEAVHRLDVPVTGCALFALDPYSLRFLNEVFAREASLHKARGTTLHKAREASLQAEKKYWAITEKPSFCLKGYGKMVHWIEENPEINKTFSFNEQKKGRKKAVLEYRVTGEGVNYLYIEILLISGRRHQIRSQFAAAGLHIKGDLKYGAKRSEKGGGIRLHARSLSFPNPLNKDEKIAVISDPPLMDNLWQDFLLQYKES